MHDECLYVREKTVNDLSHVVLQYLSDAILKQIRFPMLPRSAAGLSK